MNTGKAHRDETSYDVVIIGAGLCGLAAARALSAHSDAKIALLEKSEVGSNAPSPLTFTPVLMEHGLLDCASITYRSFCFHNHRGSAVHTAFSTDALSVLDYKKACHKIFRELRAGKKPFSFIKATAADFVPEDNRLIIGAENRRAIRAKIFIDCSGACQFMASRLKGVKASYYSNVYGAIFSDVDPETINYGAFLLPHKNFGTGGGWFYPLGGGKVSCGYASIAKEPCYEFQALRAQFERAFAEFSPYSDYLKKANISALECGIIPIQYAPQMVFGNILIAGDAAGMATNWTCMGAEPALFYGRLAGVLAARALRDGTCAGLVNFEKLWMSKNKKTYDAFSRHADLFWNADYPVWEWIIRNDLAHLKPRQLLARLRCNKHVLGMPLLYARALKFKTRCMLGDRTARRPAHIEVAERQGTPPRYCREITACRGRDTMGSKGHRLQILIKAGFPVPHTFVLTAGAYKHFVKHNRIDKNIRVIMNTPSLSSREKSQQIAAVFHMAQIPARILEDLTLTLAFSAEGSSWAVRSSSNLEDLPGCSFAGLYESYLHVQGLDQLIQAIRNCWVSLWSERAISYRQRHHFAGKTAAMAVLIQEMVTARYAGVLFTRNPVAGSAEEAVVEFCRGGGESLVAGRVSPASFRIPRDFSTDSGGDWDFPDDFGKPEIAELLVLSLRVEKIFNNPQDIEWVYGGNGFTILQSRPAQSVAASESIFIWTRANVAEVLPGVVTPLTWHLFTSTLVPPAAAPLPPSVRDEQIALAGIKRFYGRVYIRLDLFQNTFCYLPLVRPHIMRQVLGVNLPATGYHYRPPRGFRVRAAQLYFLLVVLAFPARFSRFRGGAGPLPEGTRTHLGRLIRWNARCFKQHLQATAYAVGTFALLQHCLKQWTDDKIADLLPAVLTGEKNLLSAAQGIALYELARETCKNRPLLDALLGHAEWPILKQSLADIDGGPVFVEMLENFLSVYGARAAGEFELALPRWREDPSFVLALIRNFIADGTTDPMGRRKEAREQSQREVILTIRSALRFQHQRIIFNRLIRSYRHFSTLRENLKYRLMEGYAELRTLILAMGATLVQSGRLQTVQDIFYLSPDEIQAARESDTSCLNIVHRRKTEMQSWERVTAPELVLDNGNEVPFATGRQLTGIGCSPGIVQGTARVITTVAESRTLQSGEILVTRQTDPGWTPLFLACKALVTEIGGFLSHGATVAREYGIPTVVNVAGATRQIRTGDYLRVDGTQGCVTILQSGTD